MMSANKILTVSYGTFSCTLEGFDNPLDTIKAIAECFRDLAADDRYFGGQPSTPDAAMLHRIAEGEVKRRVEAKIDDSGVIRGTDEASAPAHTDDAASLRAPVPDASPLSGRLAEDSVAAKLQRIRSAVARSAGAAGPPLAEIEDAVFIEDAATRPAITHPSVADPRAVSEHDGMPPAPEPGSLVVSEPAAGSGDAEDAGIARPASVDTPARDDVLAVLALLAAEAPRLAMQEAIVTGPTTGAADAPEAAEPPIDAERDDDVTRAFTAFPDDAQFDDGQFDDGLFHDGADMLAAGGLDHPSPADDGSETELAAPEIDGMSTTDGLAASVPETQDAALAEPGADAAEPTDTAIFAPLDQEDDGETPGPDAARLADRLRRARARVIKVRRPESPALPDADMVPVATDPLSPSRPGRTILQSGLQSGPETDEAVNRLLRQTNSGIEAADSRRRLSTMTHLKAAVAATVADRNAPADGKTHPSRVDRYRADLASVVHPAPGDALSASFPLAPLMLLSAQRIDRTAADPLPDTAPSRILPRRITVGAPEADDLPEGDRPATVSGDFAAFASRLGATTMPELLEAAAAYAHCVEGQPHFTRPQLMRHVADVSDRSLGHREDEMRGFGQLLRQGRIEKVRRGHFAIPESSQVLAEARRLNS